MSEEDVTTEPDDGVYIHGLFVECARWNEITKSLDEAVAKVLNEKMPVVRIVCNYHFKFSLIASP